MEFKTQAAIDDAYHSVWHSERARLLVEGRVKRIHVHQQAIAANRKDRTTERPVLTVQTSRGPVHGHEVEIKGASRVVYSEEPLSCGARVWIETTAEVVVS